MSTSRISGRPAGRPVSVKLVCRRLQKAYGPVEPPPLAPILDELIAVILSQNTSDANSGPAFAELQRRFPDWDAARLAPVSRIAQAIRRAGLSRQKAPRIKKILQQIHQQHGRLSLEFLRRWPPERAQQYLLEFDGVGRKSAACVLLFACRQPVLPVDTHVHRVSRRLGMIGARTGADQAHEELARLTPKELVLDFHIQLIRHGRSVCLARHPKCGSCALLDKCPQGPVELSIAASDTPAKRRRSLQPRTSRS